VDPTTSLGGNENERQPTQATDNLTTNGKRSEVLEREEKLQINRKSSGTKTGNDTQHLEKQQKIQTKDE